MKQETIFGWHFVGDKLRDGSKIPRDSVWLPKITPIEICNRGYHGSLHVFDALLYAPGNTLCYCEYRGQIIHDYDQFVAEQRRIITRMNAAEMLRYFARMQAVYAAHLWEPPDVVLDWLMTGDESLRYAARAAAGDAARDAAWAAARAAAGDAARDDAWAAWTAAGDAAGDAAWDAAWAAAWAAWTAAGDAAWAAAWAAWDPARAAARDDFAALVYECFGIKQR